MKRTSTIGLRVELAVKQAAERAADDDNRSLSSLIEKLLVEFLRRRGYLPRPGSRVGG